VATKASGHTGVMVALYPDAAAARAIAGLPGVSEAREDLHLTLAFLGDSTDTPLATNKDRLVEAVQAWAREQGTPLQGTINGVGRFFNAESDGTNAVYVAPDVPGLPELRQSLVAAIERAGFDVASNHGFTPHLTVAYVPEAAPTPDIRVETPVTFDAVTLAWGDEHLVFPLGLATATKSAKDDAAALLDAEMGWAQRLGREARRVE
jgi:2'-5' RNA ligase